MCIDCEALFIGDLCPSCTTRSNETKSGIDNVNDYKSVPQYTIEYKTVPHTYIGGTVLTQQSCNYLEAADSKHINASISTMTIGERKDLLMLVRQLHKICISCGLLSADLRDMLNNFVDSRDAPMLNYIDVFVEYEFPVAIKYLQDLRVLASPHEMKGNYITDDSQLHDFIDGTLSEDAPKPSATRDQLEQKTTKVELQSCHCCLFDFDTPTLGVRIISCAHEVCDMCVERWFMTESNSCPMCRTVI
jgi:hypothetical protein